jgi:hypothetical protein
MRMILATTLAVLAISLLPGLALAECRGGHSGETAASCMPGTVWDAGTGTCVENPTS